MRKPAVPKRNEVINMPAREEKNFISQNRREAVTSSPPKKYTFASWVENTIFGVRIIYEAS